MARLTSELMVRLLDGVTGPARKMASEVDKLVNAGSSPTGARFTAIGNNMAAAAEDASKRLDRVRGQLFDVIAVGYMVKQALTAPVGAAMSFGTMLEDIGQKAEIPVDKLGELGTKIKQVAADTNQSAFEIGRAVDAMTGMGAKADVALAAAGPIGQAATAYRAASEDLAKASWSAVDNLKVPAEEIGAAIDAMAQAGKEGAFELRDMAQYFPALGAGYQALGQQGVSAVADLAAALQIVRKGTGDSAQAATNLNNILQKMNAPQTIAAFKKMGVDLPKEMARLAKEGMTPIEALAEVTNKALKGDLANLGKLFADAQVQQGLRPLIQNLDEFRRIRDEAMDSGGTVAADYERRMQTSAMMTQRWQNSIENLNLAIGDGLLPALSGVVDQLIPIIKGITDFAQAHPQLVTNMALATAGLVSFRLAAVALRFSGLWAMSGMLSGLATAFKGLGAATSAVQNAIALQTALSNGASYTGLQKLGTALTALVRITPGLNLVGPALSAIATGLAGISLPVVAGIAAVAGAGLLIWKYWDRLTAIFSGVASAIGEKLAPAFKAAKPYLTWMTPMVKALGEAWKVVSDAAGAAGNFLGQLFSQEKLSDADKAAIAQQAADAANGIMTAIGNTFAGLGSLVMTAISSVDYVALGVKIINDLWAGIQQAFVQLGEWVKAKLAEIFTLPKIDWSFGLGGGGQPAAEPPKMARGGHIQKGSTAIVGDGGEPELFTAGATGYVTPFSKLKGMTGSAAPRGGANARGPITYAPQFINQGPIYGVADLEALWAKWEGKMHADFKAMMAGTYSDPGVA